MAIDLLLNPGKKYLLTFLQCGIVNVLNVTAHNPQVILIHLTSTELAYTLMISVELDNVLSVACQA
jgi:hypothetical protein